MKFKQKHFFALSLALSFFLLDIFSRFHVPSFFLWWLELHDSLIIAAVVTNNASNIVKAANEINHWRYIHSLAHSLTLAAKMPLKRTQFYYVGQIFWQLTLKHNNNFCRHCYQVSWYHIIFPHSNPATVKLHFTSIKNQNQSFNKSTTQDGIRNSQWFKAVIGRINDSNQFSM